LYYLIYKTTCIVNGKFYIGKHKTENLEDGYLGSGKLLRRAIKKYGRENFKREVLQFCSSNEEMNEAEKNHVVLCEESYNLCPGGEGGWDYVNKNGLTNRLTGFKNEQHFITFQIGAQKVATKAGHIGGKISGKITYKANFKNANSIETIEKRKETFKRIQHQQGEKHSQFGTCWMTNARENIKVKKQEIDFYISLGYRKGRIMKF
jgi:hypothetical protein